MIKNIELIYFDATDLLEHKYQMLINTAEYDYFFYMKLTNDGDEAIGVSFDGNSLNFFLKKKKSVNFVFSEMAELCGFGIKLNNPAAIFIKGAPSKLGGYICLSGYYLKDKQEKEGECLYP